MKKLIPGITVRLKRDPLEVYEDLRKAIDEARSIPGFVEMQATTCGGDLYIKLWREETETEREARLAAGRERKREAAKARRELDKAFEANERATYEKLKKKYGD